MIKNLKDNKNCSQDGQPSRFYFVTKNYRLKDKASLFLNVMFSLIFYVFILKRQRGRIHCLYTRSSLCFKILESRMIVFLLFQNIKEL